MTGTKNPVPRKGRGVEGDCGVGVSATAAEQGEQGDAADQGDAGLGDGAHI